MLNWSTLKAIRKLFEDYWKSKKPAENTRYPEVFQGFIIEVPCTVEPTILTKE